MVEQKFLILMLWALTATVRAANVTVLVVNRFGQPIPGCQIDSLSIESGKGTRLQYQSRFQGLVAKNVPLGEYDMTVRCGEVEINKRFTMDRVDQFEVVASSGRFMISDHRKAKLTVKFDGPGLSNETWWIRLSGIYNEKTYTERFEPGEAQAAVTDPDPGSYLITVSSTGGYSCAREVDFAEWTKTWIFHSASCSFDFDRFAHRVQDEDKRAHKTGGWYQEMVNERDILRRAIEEAIEKSHKDRSDAPPHSRQQ